MDETEKAAIMKEEAISLVVKRFSVKHEASDGTLPPHVSVPETDLKSTDPNAYRELLIEKLRQINIEVGETERAWNLEEDEWDDDDDDDDDPQDNEEKDVTTRFAELEDRNVQQELVSNVSRIIYDILSASNVDRPDTLIFLDKSARPLYWLMKDLWREMKIPLDFPNVKFANIGVKQQSEDDTYGGVPYNYVDTEDQMEILVRVLGNELADRVRVGFGYPAIVGETDKQKQGYFKGTNKIWVIDDTSVEGTTLAMAAAIFDYIASYEGAEVTRAVHAYEQNSNGVPWLRQDSMIGVTEEGAEGAFVRPLGGEQNFDNFSGKLRRMLKEIAQRSVAEGWAYEISDFENTLDFPSNKELREYWKENYGEDEEE